MIGKRLGDRFVVGEELGGGGMSAVHRGRDERLNEDVAIKFLRKVFAEDPLVRERFRREAMALAKLRHPGIVSVLDFGEADGELYIVLELVKGTTLEHTLFAGAMPALRAAPVFDQLLGALELCHAAGVVHRDIKPSNIMLSGDRVTLIDFGLVRVASTEGGLSNTKLTETGTVHGTPSYMAPEQCRGDEVGTEADVYAVGVCLYEALSGQPLFNGDNAAVLMAQHLFTAPAPLPQLSRGLEATIMHALAKRPEDRPTAASLRSMLGSAFKGTDPEALAAVAAQHRAHVAGLPRHERALTGRPPAAAETHPLIQTTGGTVALWMAPSDHAADFQGCLGVAGIACSLHASSEPPAADVVIASARDGLDRLAALGKRPFVVVDVNGPDETTRAIRLGAADMLLAGAPVADVVPKIQKALRKKKR